LWCDGSSTIQRIIVRSVATVARERKNLKIHGGEEEVLQIRRMSWEAA
jgi:hypothetical protein